MNYGRFLNISLLCLSFFILNGMDKNLENLSKPNFNLKESLWEEYPNDNAVNQLFGYETLFSNVTNIDNALLEPFLNYTYVNKAISPLQNNNIVESIPYAQPKSRVARYRDHSQTSFGKILALRIFECYFHNCGSKMTFFELQNHMYVHIRNEGKKKYSCIDCNFRATKGDQVIEKHSPIRFKCMECPRTLSSFYKVGGHYKENHLLGKIVCPLQCNKELLAASLPRHLDHVHPEIVDEERVILIKELQRSQKKEFKKADVPSNAFRIVIK